MSNLKEQNFGFGAGLTALFDYNEGILPSFIEDVTETRINGKNTKVTNGKFFKVTTLKKNEFIIYIKYSDKVVANDNMVSGIMWEFSLTETEKNKIESQFQNTGDLFILLVCINKSDKKLPSQVALLRWEDYCKIRHRSNIQLGIWKKDGVMKQGAKTYCLRNGRGQKREYFLEIKRNLIEKSLDQLYRDHISEVKQDDPIDRQDRKIHESPESQYVETEAEVIWADENTKNIEKKKVFIKDNVSWCGRCRCKTVSSRMQYSNRTSNGRYEIRNLDGHQCPKCKQFYITLRSYEVNLKEMVNHENGLEIQRIKTLVDKVYLSPHHGCIYCDSQLSISPCRLKLYKNLQDNNQIEKNIDTELFYCKSCGIYYAEKELYNKLIKEYGSNKINFVDDKNPQMTLAL